MFQPISDIEYNVLLKNGKKIIITFTFDNYVYEEEKFCDFETFECYDNDDVRYICYVRVCECDRDKEYIELKSKTMEGEILCHYIHKLNLNEETLYHNKNYDK